MELGELKKRVLEIFEVKDVKGLADSIFETVKANDFEKYIAFKDAVVDLSTDWMQKIFQYYQADRKDKKQDYTPASLAKFVSRLAGDEDSIVDMCAGSGSLTIQKWSLNPTAKFELYEIDSNVIPYLLFNMAVRNIECVVYHADILQQETFHTYRIHAGAEFGRLEGVTNG